MNRVPAVVSAALLTLAVAVFAQSPPSPPKPGPEHQKLAYFAGDWVSDVDMKPSPFGPGGKSTSTGHAEWMPGGFFLVSHAHWKGTAMGDGTEMSVLGYDPNEKVYTYHSFNSMGESDFSKGTVEGDTWTWLSDNKMGGKAMKGRFTIKTLSPTSYTFKFEIAPETGAWSTVMDGKATKTK
jgi:hypothetical protein